MGGFGRQGRLVYGAIIICLLVLGSAWWSSYQLGFLSLRKDALNELFRYRTSIENLLERYRPLPDVLAVHPLLRQGLDGESGQADVDVYLRYFARVTQASVIYLMDIDGNTIAASNSGLPGSFVGRNFSFRPYFQQALTEERGRFFGLGTTSKQRGYYFSHRVMSGDRVAGVVVVKINLDGIEDAWVSPWDRGQAGFVVSDPSGVIFISSQPSWRLKALGELQSQQLQQIRQRRQYDGRDLPTLPLSSSPLPFVLEGTNSELYQLKASDLNEKNHSFLVQNVFMPEAGWRLHLFIRTSSVERVVLITLLVTSALLIVALLSFLYWRERKRNYLQLQRTRDHLDRRVRERTRDLTLTNKRLENEIVQHHQTEQILRSTRDELVQAAKLAAIGQMSAGINHELNQPLTAIRNYVENAGAFLERGQNQRVENNLYEITGLTEHMAGIVGQFKVFSRRSDNDTQPEPVNLSEAIEGARKIVEPQLRNGNVIISVACGADTDVVVDGSLVRIEQIFVNLFSNAVQALVEAKKPEISVLIQRLDKQAWITVCDNGAGFADEAKTKLFDPFYTTRSIDQGLGLGLSITRTIIEGLGGQITANNHSKGGAEFVLLLPLSQWDHSCMTEATVVEAED